MFAEDYVDFVKDCKKTLSQIEAIQSQPSKELRDSDLHRPLPNILQQLAKQQVVIANYMAMMAGIDDYED
jgi:hypothetical protein